MKFKLSRYIGATKLPHEQEIYSKHIIFSTRTGKSLLMNYELYNQLMNGAYEVIPTDMLLKLFNYEIIVPEHENEFQTMMTQNRIGIDESVIVGGQMEGKQPRKGKGIGGRTRVLYTVRHDAYDAKNRLNLPPDIEMGDSPSEGFQNFMGAIKAGRANAQAAQTVQAAPAPTTTTTAKENE
jgi:hypothetical protein